MSISSATHSSPAFFKLINKPLKARMFLLSKLPAAYFSGLRVMLADENKCAVSVPFKWFTQNPFRSTYFACLGMAAEMSTGILSMANIYQRKPSVSMLITGMESRFHKKAVGKTIFTCNEGALIKEAIENAIASGSPETIRVYSSGHNQQNELIAEFWFTWSFKLKQ
jgi:hypothetical protein